MFGYMYYDFDNVVEDIVRIVRHFFTKEEMFESLKYDELSCTIDFSPEFFVTYSKEEIEQYF